MSTLSVEVHFGRNLGVLEGEKIDGRILDVHPIVFGLHDKRWWSFLGNVDLRIRREVLLREGEIARIDDHREVRAATKLIGSIDRIVEALIEVGAERGSEVSSRGEAEDADALRSMCHSVACERTIPNARCAS